MRIRFPYVIVLAVLISCSPVTSIKQSQTNIPTVTVLPENTATVTSNPSVSLSPTIDALNTPPASSSTECFGSQQDMPANLSGEFVLSGYYDLYVNHDIQSHRSPSYILIPSTGDKLPIPLKSTNDSIRFSVSPNKKWFAYYAPQTGKNGQLVLIGNNGKVQEIYPTVNWWGLMGWIDDNRLLISKLAAENPFTSFVFDPFKNNLEKELHPNYPDIYTGRPSMDSWGAYGLSETVYNPGLSMVVYPKNPSTIVLWDIKAKKEIAKITDLSSQSNAPLWLANGKEFVIDVTAKNSPDHWNQDELISVSVNGEIKQLTHLADHYKDVYIQPYSESADGRYIAFWFIQVGSSGPSQLAIYDTITENTRVFCLKLGGYTTPIWAPESHQLLVDGTFDTLDNYGTIFVDIESNVMAQVEKDVIPVGWLLNP